MSAIYYLNVTVHVLAALLWLGGMFFFAALGAPVRRRVEPPALRAVCLMVTEVGNGGRWRSVVATGDADWLESVPHRLAAAWSLAHRPHAPSVRRGLKRLAAARFLRINSLEITGQKVVSDTAVGPRSQP